MANPADPQSILILARRGLMEIGYRAELLHEGHLFDDLFEASSNPRTIELAGFGHSVPSYRNACIGVTFVSEDSSNPIRPFRSLGAPHLLAVDSRRGRVIRWRIRGESDPERIGDFASKDLDSEIREHRAEWNPQQLM